MLRLKSRSLVGAMVSGYVLYFALFECLTLPMVLLHVPLSVFCMVWGATLSVPVIFSIVALRPFWMERLGHLPKLTASEWGFFLVMLLCIAFQVLTAILYQDASADGAYYVGTASTSVYTNTLGRYNPYTGAPLRNFSSRYVFSCYPMHNAFVSQALHLSTIVQSKVVMTGLHVGIANILYYRLGLRLFGAERKKACLFVLFLCVINCMTGTLYTPGTFLFTRAYEGKALLANFSVFFTVYCCLWLYQEKKPSAAPWILLFLGNLTAVCFSGTAIFLPALTCAGLLPVFWKRKNLRTAAAVCFCLLPLLVYAGLYLLARAGILVLAA